MIRNRLGRIKKKLSKYSKKDSLFRLLKYLEVNNFYISMMVNKDTLSYTFQIYHPRARERLTLNVSMEECIMLNFEEVIFHHLEQAKDRFDEKLIELGIKKDPNRKLP